MSNTVQTPTVLARELILQLENNIRLPNLVMTEYSKEFKSIGNSLNIIVPAKAIANSGRTISSYDDHTESTRTLTLNQQWNTNFLLSQDELTYDVDMKQWSERFIKPRVIPLANKFDEQLAARYIDIPYSVGTPGTRPSTFAVWADALAMLQDNGAPDNIPVNAVMSPKTNASMVDALKGTYVQEIAKTVMRDAHIGKIANQYFWWSQNITRHTVGGDNSTTPLVAGASQTGSTLAVDGLASSAPVKGDVFTIDGVYAVNPVSKASRTDLQQFVLTADATVVGGASTFSIYPAITTSGAFQTVSGSPANDATITFWGTAGTSYTQNLVFMKPAFALGVAPLAMPDNAKGERITHKGMSITHTSQYDIDNFRTKHRLDILFGTLSAQRELAVRVWGD